MTQKARIKVKNSWIEVAMDPIKLYREREVRLSSDPDLILNFCVFLESHALRREDLDTEVGAYMRGRTRIIREIYTYVNTLTDGELIEGIKDIAQAGFEVKLFVNDELIIESVVSVDEFGQKTIEAEEKKTKS